MKTLSIIASLLLAVSAFGQAVSRTELRATNSQILVSATNIANAAINNARTNLLPFINVTNWGVLNDGNDIGPALQALMEVHKNTGARMYFGAGTNFQLDSYLYIPTNTGVVPPQQSTFIWIGAGAKKKGQSVASFGGTRINMGFTNGPFKIFSGGLGAWKVEDIDFQIKAGREGNKAVLATFTSLVWDNWSHGGATSGSNAIADFIQFGGVGTGNFTDWSTNASAQGYGTDMGRWYVDRTRTVFTLNDHANDYNLGHGFVGHGSGGHRAIVLQTNGWGSLVGVVIPHVGFEGPSYTNLLYLDGAIGTYANISAYDPVIPCTVVVFTNGASSSYVREIFIDTGFRDYNTVAGNDFATSHIGKTNYQSVAQRYANTVRYDASVPFTLPHADTSYSYPAVNDNGITWYHVTSGGAARAQFRSIDTSATETKLTLQGSVTAILDAPGELILDGNPPIFKVAGVEKARINSTGTGIGTNNPQTTLHIHGDTTLNGHVSATTANIAGTVTAGTFAGGNFTQDTGTDTSTLGAVSANSLEVTTTALVTGDATMLARTILDGPLVRIVQRIGGGSVDVSSSGTNGYYWATNGSSTLNFAGAATAGERLAITISNYSASSITITSSLPIFDAEVGSNVTLHSVSPGEWKFEIETNAHTGRWEFVTDRRPVMELRFGTGVVPVTNGNVITVSASYLNQTIAGVGGANTNFTGQATDGVVYIDGGTTNVNFVAIMPGTTGQTYFPTYIISNLTTTARQLSFSSITNFLIPLQFYDGISFPITITNKHRVVFTAMLNGSNTTWAAKQCTNGF